MLREREEGRERNIDWLHPVRTWTGAQTCNLGMCPDWESNPGPFGAGGSAPAYGATQPGQHSYVFLQLEMIHTTL